MNYHYGLNLSFCCLSLDIELRNVAKKLNSTGWYCLCNFPFFLSLFIKDFLFNRQEPLLINQAPYLNLTFSLTWPCLPRISCSSRRATRRRPGSPGLSSKLLYRTKVPQLFFFIWWLQANFNAGFRLKYTEIALVLIFSEIGLYGF